ncbi:hypothetical protein HBI78_242130 [Parastagonospora nodorum]|nr:hypothetical protein HBI78_242130 [Parastagonospora nodorum]
MLQTNIREGYGITTLEVIKLIENLISYVKKKDLLEKIQLEKSQSQLLKSLRLLTAKVKTEDLSNTLTLILSKTAQRRSSSVVSNRSIALITDKFSVALLTKPAILNNANIALVDAVHYSQKLEENYFKVRAQHLKYDVIDALIITLIKDDDDLLGTVNSYIKLRRLRAVMLLCQTTKPLGDSNKDRPPLKRRKTEAADSRHAKVSRRRIKKDKDLEDSDTSSDVLRLRRRDRAAASQLKKTRDKEELAKLDGLLDSDDYRLDSSSDINPEDDSEDEEATTAKDLAREQKEKLKALLNAKTRDSLSARVGTAMEHCTLEDCDFTSYQLTDAYILYFKELLSDNGGIFANAIEVQNARVEGNATEHNAVNNDDKLCPTEGERTFYCADPLALQFCFFSNSPLENISRLTKEEAIEMQIDTTNAISKALAAANKLVALRSYVLEGFIIVCGFGKVDKHVFRAYNTISVTAQRTIIRKGGPYIEKRVILLSSYVTDIRSYNYRYQWKAWALSGTPMEQGLNEILIFVSLALISLQNRKERDSVTSDRIYKIEDAVYHLAMAKQWRNMIANVKHDASKHESSHDCLCLDFLSTVQNAKQQCRDILEKEGLNELEASRRVIFNRFEMQAIASYSALATLKAAQFKIYSSCKVKRFTSNSVKDLFTNLSKDYFLVREARAITKSSPKFQNLLNLCSKVKILGTLSRTWSIAAEDAAKAANTLLPPKEVRAKILIESYKPIKFSDESVLVMQRGMIQHEINLKLAKWRDLDGPWIIVASIAFAEAITLTEATHVVIIEPQDRQNTQD